MKKQRGGKSSRTLDWLVPCGCQVPVVPGSRVRSEPRGHLVFFQEAEWEGETLSEDAHKDEIPVPKSDGLCTLNITFEKQDTEAMRKKKQDC